MHFCFVFTYLRYRESRSISPQSLHRSPKWSGYSRTEQTSTYALLFVSPEKIHLLLAQAACNLGGLDSATTLCWARQLCNRYFVTKSSKHTVFNLFQKNTLSFLYISTTGGPVLGHMGPLGPIEGVGPQTPNFFRESRGSQQIENWFNYNF